MARRTRVRNGGLFRFDRGNKSKRVGSNVIVFNGLFNVRHMAGRTSTSLAVRRVMRVLTHATFEPRRIERVVATKAESIALCNQVRIVLVAVNVVTIEAS